MSKIDLTTTSAVMDALGGNVPVAELTGRTPTAVSNWRRFDAFPANTYVALTQALDAIGRRAPASLWSMAGARRERSAA